MSDLNRALIFYTSHTSGCAKQRPTNTTRQSTNIQVSVLLSPPRVLSSEIPSLGYSDIWRQFLHYLSRRRSCPYFQTSLVLFQFEGFQVKQWNRQRTSVELNFPLLVRTTARPVTQRDSYSRRRHHKLVGYIITTASSFSTSGFIHFYFEFIIFIMRHFVPSPALHFYTSGSRTSSTWCHLRHPEFRPFTRQNCLSYIYTTGRHANTSVPPLCWPQGTQRSYLWVLHNTSQKRNNQPTKHSTNNTESFNALFRQGFQFHLAAQQLTLLHLVHFINQIFASYKVFW